jgi:hypothetical protein
VLVSLSTRADFLWQRVFGVSLNAAVKDVVVMLFLCCYMIQVFACLYAIGFIVYHFYQDENLIDDGHVLPKHLSKKRINWKMKSYLR